MTEKPTESRSICVFWGFSFDFIKTQKVEVECLSFMSNEKPMEVIQSVRNLFSDKYKEDEKKSVENIFIDLILTWYECLQKTMFKEHFLTHWSPPSFRFWLLLFVIVNLWYWSSLLKCSVISLGVEQLLIGQINIYIAFHIKTLCDLDNW